MRPINPDTPLIPGISQAMLVEGGKLLFLSGHVPYDAEGGTPEGLEAQLTQTFENMGATLAAAGVDFETLARITLYVKDYTPDQLPVIRQVRDRYINLQKPPASALIGVANLFQQQVLVEIDAIAVVA